MICFCPSQPTIVDILNVGWWASAAAWWVLPETDLSPALATRRDRLRPSAHPSNCSQDICKLTTLTIYLCLRSLPMSCFSSALIYSDVTSNKWTPGSFDMSTVRVNVILLQARLFNYEVLRSISKHNNLTIWNLRRQIFFWCRVVSFLAARRDLLGVVSDEGPCHLHWLVWFPGRSCSRCWSASPSPGS